MRLTALLCLLASAAFAEGRSVDLGVGAGLNTPSGVGVEGIWRIDRIVALGAAAGYGSWGPRMSLIGRVHLESSIAQGLFLEPSLTVNFGGQRSLAPEATSVPPVGNFTVAGGYRWSFAERLWLVLRVGQSFSFGAPSSMSTASSSQQVGATEQFTRLMFKSDGPPAGWVLGLATGASI
ncbi:MAG: hypothetical protein IPJ65_32480 [Archangiaceae bacterium]|nr:hypothetical protein [Archangiaceae bacterium]